MLSDWQQGAASIFLKHCSELPARNGQPSDPWFALRVRSRAEKTVAAFLEAKGFEWFLPQYKCRRRWSDRIQELASPLFPGYLFSRFDPLQRLPILTIPGVVQIVGMGRTPIPVDEAEIAAIQAAIQSGFSIQPWPFLEIGDWVRIEAGALRGLEGILTDFRGQHRVVLSVSLLQRSVALEIDGIWLTRISRPRRALAERAVGPHSKAQRGTLTCWNRSVA